jgi:hypothetical protein
MSATIPTIAQTIRGPTRAEIAGDSTPDGLHGKGVRDSIKKRHLVARRYFFAASLNFALARESVGPMLFAGTPEAASISP